MTDVALHREVADHRDDDSELADRALALARGVLVVASPRSLIAGSLAGFGEHVRQRLIGNPVGIVIDCARSEYIDSSGLALLFSLAKEATRRGVGYRVARLDENLRYLLALTRIDHVISVSDTLRDAIAEASAANAPGAHDSAQVARTETAGGGD